MVLLRGKVSWALLAADSGRAFRRKSCERRQTAFARVFAKLVAGTCRYKLARCAFWSSFTRRSRAQAGGAASRALTRMASSSFTALPDDVLQRVLLGVLLDDHLATAAACRAFRDVIRGPRFLRLRREYGFAERGVILVGSTHYLRTPIRAPGPWGFT